MHRALQIDQASYGQEHPTVAADLNNLAELLQATNRRAEAEPMYRHALNILIAFAKQGYQHHKLETVIKNYSALLQAQGLSETAIQAKLDSLREQS